MVGGNSQPLGMLGHVELPTTVGKFQSIQVYNCEQLNCGLPLGADFLVQHEAAINCNNINLCHGQNGMSPTSINTDNIPDDVVTPPALRKQCVFQTDK